MSADPLAFTTRVYVRFRDGRIRVDIVGGDSKYETRINADSHARALRDRADVENAFRLEDDEDV